MKNCLLAVGLALLGFCVVARAAETPLPALPSELVFNVSNKFIELHVTILKLQIYEESDTEHI